MINKRITPCGQLKFISIAIMAVFLLSLPACALPEGTSQSPEISTQVATIVQAESSTNDAYDYPIKPSSDEWKAFTSYDEKAAACQIPADILKNMSTSGLIETVLNYPLLNGFRAHDDLQQGFDRTTSSFNGLRELLNRKDAGTELLKIYSTMDPTAIKDEWTSSQRGSYAWEIQDIEMLLAQEPICANLTAAQCHELISLAEYKSKLMQGYPDTYGVFSRKINSLLIEGIKERQASAK